MLELFTLYVGSGDSTTAGKLRGIVTNVVRSKFESFTLVKGEGHFRKAREPVCLVRIATDDVEKILAVAAELRSRLRQDGVGIEYGGAYYRCTASDCASALRRQFVDRRRE